MRTARIAGSTLVVAFTSISLAACNAEPPMALPTVRLAIVPGAEHGGAPLTTAMTQEVTHTPVWAGDPDGTGSALVTINRGQGELCWDINVADILLPASASHIHRAAPGVRGPIVVGLTAPDAGGHSSGCASNVDPALLEDLLKSPEAYYVNVHNSVYPAGAVRGQLDK